MAGLRTSSAATTVMSCSSFREQTRRSSVRTTQVQLNPGDVRSVGDFEFVMRACRTAAAGVLPGLL